MLLHYLAQYKEARVLKTISILTSRSFKEGTIHQLFMDCTTE